MHKQSITVDKIPFNKLSTTELYNWAKQFSFPQWRALTANSQFNELLLDCETQKLEDLAKKILGIK